MTHVPEGFIPLPRSSPLLDLLGPVYCRGEGLHLQLGLRADNRHANGRGTVHGGVLATLADVGMGYAMAFSSDPPLPLITASMTLDLPGWRRRAATGGDSAASGGADQRVSGQGKHAGSKNHRTLTGRCRHDLPAFEHHQPRR